VFSSNLGTSSPGDNNYRIRCDGLFHAVPFGFLSCKWDTSSFVEGTTKGLDGHSGYWTREVSADSQEMRLSEYKDAGRTKLERIRILDRVK